jgi:hypothetical protein
MFSVGWSLGWSVAGLGQPSRAVTASTSWLSESIRCVGSAVCVGNVQVLHAMSPQRIEYQPRSLFPHMLTMAHLGSAGAYGRGKTLGGGVEGAEES